MIPALKARQLMVTIALVVSIGISLSFVAGLLAGATYVQRAYTQQQLTGAGDARALNITEAAVTRMKQWEEVARACMRFVDTKGM